MDNITTLSKPHDVNIIHIMIMLLCNYNTTSYLNVIGSLIYAFEKLLCQS